MIAAGTQANPLPDASITQNTGVELTEIFLSVAPFLDGVQRQLAEQVAAFDPEIAPYAEYALSRQGKQLRAALTGLAANCAGGWNDGVTRAAVIIEMVHLATLVHDDIMDEAKVRRGQPTLASKWGNSVAVLTGDCLFAHSLKLASEFPTTNVCRAVSTATRNVCSGEIIQNNRKGDLQLNEAQYFDLSPRQHFSATRIVPLDKILKALYAPGCSESLEDPECRFACSPLSNRVKASAESSLVGAAR